MYYIYIYLEKIQSSKSDMKRLLAFSTRCQIKLKYQINLTYINRPLTFIENTRCQIKLPDRIGKGRLQFSNLKFCLYSPPDIFSKDNDLKHL